MDIAAIARPEFRFLHAIPTALTITVLLLYLMHRLVYVETPVIEEPPVKTVMDVIYVPKIIKNQYESVKPDKVQEPKVEPQAPKAVNETFEKTTFFTGQTLAYNPTNEGTLNIHLGANDSVVQQVMVPPQYPRSALAKGIEGYVDVIFEVSALGVPKDVRVTNSKPEGVFEKHAVKAVKRWKYLPRDAESATSITVQERIRFKITNP
jgi:periplasmic protein TonB